MSLSKVCDSISEIDNETPVKRITEISRSCEKYLGNAVAIIDAIENSLGVASGRRCLLLWILVDQLSKLHTIFLDAFRPIIINLALNRHPEKSSAEYQEFLLLLDQSFSVLFGPALVSLITMQLNRNSDEAQAVTVSRPTRALTVRDTSLKSIGGFSANPIQGNARPGSQRHALQVKTLDSHMSMNVASSYSPAQPTEIITDLQPDADAPQGYMKALPSDYNKTYAEDRRKRLREIMENNREQQAMQKEKRVLERVRQASRMEEEEGSRTDSGRPGNADDIKLPSEFPRDEYGVKIGNFPLGVRFLRDAIRDCGGAVELEVLSHRVATLASREAVANFGNLREFLSIHSPTFRLQLEHDQWIVRLTESLGEDTPTWELMECPHCAKKIKGRNFARHRNSRTCIKGQIALGIDGDYLHRGPIAELAHAAKRIISQRDSFDDGDIDMFADCLKSSAEVRRFRLSSTRHFSPILKAVRIIRDRWLSRKGVEEMDHALISVDDFSVANLFSLLGRSIHRLPIPWIEMGDIIDMCHRFSKEVLPPFNPPPRPADPRISLYNEYPGFLLCESEVDDDDDPSGEDERFSDDDAPMFTFAPPVDVAETIFTAGFSRDTKRLQHRMRTAPPMILNRVLKGDGSQTLREMYADTHSTRSAPRRL